MNITSLSIYLGGRIPTKSRAVSNPYLCAQHIVE